MEESLVQRRKKKFVLEQLDVFKKEKALNLSYVLWAFPELAYTTGLPDIVLVAGMH